MGRYLYNNALMTITVIVLLILSFGCADTKHMIKYYDRMYQGQDTVIMYPEPGGLYIIDKEE